MSGNLNNLREEHLHFLKEGIQFINREEPELQELISQLTFEQFQLICDEDFSWAYLYELSVPQFFTLIFAAFGLLPALVDSIKSGTNSNQAFIDKINELMKDPDAFLSKLFNLDKEPVTIEDLKKIRINGIFTISDILVLCNAVQLQVKSLRKNGKLLSEFIADVRNGKEESFWLALQIDPTILSASVFSRRVSIAFIQQDHDFFKLLGNSLKVKRKKKKTELDSLRVILHACNEAKWLENLSQDATAKLFIDRLHVYSDNGDDPERSLYRFIDRWKKTL